MVDIEMRAGQMDPVERPGGLGVAATLRRPGGDESFSQGSTVRFEQDDRGGRAGPAVGAGPGQWSAPSRREQARALAEGIREDPVKGGVALGLVGLFICIVLALMLGGGKESPTGGGEPGGGEGDGPRPTPHPPYVPPDVDESGRLPFSSGVFFETQEGASLTQWECACQQDCDDPMVKGIMGKLGKDCPAADGKGLLISNDLEDCRLAMPFVSAAGAGKTCVSRDAVKSSCKEVLDGWWDVKLGAWRGDTAFEAWKEFGRTVETDEVLERFARDIHDLPLLRWAEKERAGKTEDMKVEDFIAYAQPKCVETVLRVFAGGELTQLSGSRLFDTVFEDEAPKASTPPSIASLTYGWLRDDTKATVQWGMHPKIEVNGKKEKEHHKFKQLRKQFGVRDSFLNEAGPAGVASDFTVTCEPLSDPHAQVRWRSFHVLAEGYFEYMKKNTDSLLPRVYSAWFSESDSKLCYAMQSIVPGHFIDHKEWSQGLSSATLFFELKGSTSLKDYFGQQHQYVYSNGPLKDADFKRDHVLMLPAQIREELMEQLEADTQWLSQNNIMDYSLQLLRVKVGDSDASTLKRVCPGAPDHNGKMHRAFFQRDGGFSGTAAPWDSCIYLWAIALGNTLQPYSLYEAFFAAMNKVVHPGRKLTDVDPETYSESLQAFIIEHSKSEIEVPPGVDASAAPQNYQAAFIYQKCSESEESGEVKAPRLPTCESINLEDVVPEIAGLLEGASRDFTEEEVQAARKQSNVEKAQCVKGTAPASFVVGPSATDSDLDAISAPPAGTVQLSRSIWRRHHRGYQELVQFAQNYGCVSQSGWEAVNAVVIRQEKKLLEEATQSSCRKAVVIRNTCSTYWECEEQMRLLKGRGYKVSVEGRAVPKGEKLEMGRSKADSLGEYFDSDSFDLSVAAVIPLMALSNGECSLVLRPLSGSVPAAGGLGWEEYDPFAPQALESYKIALLDTTGVSQSELIRAEKMQGLDAGSCIAKSLCDKGVQFTADHLDDDMAAIMQQLAVLCEQEEAGSIPPLRFEPVLTGSGNFTLDFLLMAMENLKHGVTIESLHPKSLEFWMKSLADHPPRRASYLMPLGAAWMAFNKTWGVSASAYLDSAMLGMYKRYAIKGVPTFRNLEDSGPDSVYRDANWVAHFVSEDGKTASVGIAQEHWDKLVTHLAEDLDLLQSIGSVGYSMLVSVFEGIKPDPNAQNPLGKRAWQAFNFGTQDLEVVLFGGVVDYLQTTEDEYLEGRVMGKDISDELIESPGKYACRLFLFVTTQMLAPCKWPKEESTPSSCVKDKDWTEAFENIFKTQDTSAANAFLPQICEKFDGGPAGLRAIAAGLLMHVDEKLDSDRPCVDGFRAPEHCIDKWKYKGEEYTQCARTLFEYSEVRAPWCSWEPELPEASGWDGPWSYCTRCFDKCVETADVEAVLHPCQCGEHLCQTGRTCNKDARPGIGFVCEDLDGRTLAKKLCESVKGGGDTDGDMQEIMDYVLDLCESGQDVEAELLPATRVGDKEFLLKAQKNLPHGLVIKELTSAEKEDWEQNFAFQPPRRESYLVPLATTFEAYGKVWGVEPNSFLDDAPSNGDNYNIKGFTNFVWTNDWPQGLSISQEHWEKLTIRLSKDMQMLKDAKSNLYEMRMTVFDEPLFDKKNSRGKHVWRAHGWDDNRNYGVLVGGVTDYLNQRNPDDSDSEDASDSIYACRFFLFVTTQALTPCRWSRSVDNPEEKNCVRDFTPVFEAILGKGEVPPATDQHALNQICRLIDEKEGSLMRFEADLLAHVIDKLDGDMPCESGVRLPEHCVQKTKYDGKDYTGCVSDVHLFDDIQAPWCAWEAELGSTEWDGPWSYCVMCPQNTPAPPDEPPADGKGTPAPPDQPPTGGSPVSAWCHKVKHETKGPYHDPDDLMQDTLEQLRRLCQATGDKLPASSVDSSRGDGRMLLLKAQDPLKTDLVFRPLTENEQAYARGQRNAPVEHSLLVPLLSFYEHGDEVWVVMPSTKMNEGSVGIEMKSYDIVGLPNDPRNKEWLNDYPASDSGFTGVGISQEHWAKLTTRLVEDLRTLKEHHAIEYSLEVTTYKRSPEEDSPAKNSRGKHVLRAYDPRTKGLIGVLPGGVVDYLKDSRLENHAGVPDNVYACEFLITTATQVFSPCKWPYGADGPPKDADCVTDFYPAFQQMLGKDAETLPPREDPSLINEFCTALEDYQANLFAYEGGLLEFVDKKLNGDKPCIGAHDGKPGFRPPEHCVAKFTYGGDELSGCVPEKDKPIGFSDIAAPWCSWTDTLHGSTDWDGPWSFCTRCTAGDTAALS